MRCLNINKLKNRCFDFSLFTVEFGTHATIKEIKLSDKPMNSNFTDDSKQTISEMRSKLGQAFSTVSNKNEHIAIDKPNISAKISILKIKGLEFPHALTILASAWLGASTPTKSALKARFGTNPTEETIFALASELGAKIEVNKAKPKDLEDIKTPFIAELSDGKAIIILSISDNDKKIVQTIGNDGKASYEFASLLEKLSGNWVSVYEALKSDSQEAGAFNDRITRVTNAIIPASISTRLRRLLNICLEGSKKDFIRMLIAAALSNSLLVILPLFITIVYDRVVPHGAFETLIALTIGVILALSIDVGLRAARVNLQEAIGVKAGLKLQAAVYRKLVTIELEKGQQAAKGFFTMLPELDHAALITPAVIAAIIADLPFVIIMLGLIYILTGPVVFVPIFGIGVIIGTVIYGNIKAKKLAPQTYQARVDLQDQAIETCATLATSKATRSEHELLNSWARKTDISAYLSHQTRQSMAITNQFVMNITQMTIVLTIVAGAVAVNAGAMTLGNLAAATLLVGRIISPVSQLISQLGQFANIQGSLDSIFALIDEKEEFGGDENSLSQSKFKGNISFNNVNFAYAGSEKQSLIDVNINITPGEKIGIIGRNGGGKSTLLKLVPRFYLPQSGTIMLDGTDSRQVSPFMLRQSIGYMSQDTVLMNDTIRANICAGAANIDEESFNRAVALSGVNNFTKNHPKGYNLNVGPRGEHLSGGERQAVGLARAILQNPNVLLLDEPTSAMDNSAEAELIKNLPQFLHDKTVLIATHRMQLLKLVDRIIWMENGQVVADGARDEVLSSLKKAG